VQKYAAQLKHGVHKFFCTIYIMCIYEYCGKGYMCAILKISMRY